ncbi:MAG: AAA family ATPase [Myxococcota bacterium]|nr:AAA family ATPase [Myxococcota bacterium]
MRQYDKGASLIEAIRARARQVFRYLVELHRHRTPVERRLDQHSWHLWLDSLPDHHTVQLRSAQTAADDAGRTAPDDAALLRVARPKTTKPPAPPAELREWLEAGWEDPRKRAPQHHASRNRQGPSGEARVERFEESSERRQAFEAWRKLREQWAINELPAREALRLFERLYELHGHLERESEQELVLGDGVLSWKLGDNGVFHPVLLQAVQLVFDADVPEFRVLPSDRPTALHAQLLQALPEIDARVLGAVRQELDTLEVQALGGEETSGFLQALAVRLSAKGRFFEEGRPPVDSPEPSVGRAPVLFVRSRNHGLAAALEVAAESVEQADEFPAAIARIIGIDAGGTRAQGGDGNAAPSGTDTAHDVFFSKLANKEQFRIAEHLERHSCVLVQGPPGTGKTHTIANLIGHLLAQGQTVLVTAHTTKALRVVREGVVEQLRPLCVSVLDSDLDSRSELEAAVSAIVQRLSMANAEQLGWEKHALLRQRELLRTRVQRAERALVEARWAEFREVEFDSVRLQPADAARRVTEGTERHQWIPGPIAAGAPLPLSVAEFGELYASNGVSADDEAEAASPLPHTGSLPSSEEFGRWCDERRRLADEPRDTHAHRWSVASAAVSVEALEQVTEHLLGSNALIAQTELWVRVPAQYALAGDAKLRLWFELAEQVTHLYDVAVDAASILFNHGPALPGELDPAEAMTTVDEIARHLEGGGSLSAGKLLFNPKWGRLIKVAQINGAPPKRAEHFRALGKLLEIRMQRQAFCARWDNQMATLGAPRSAELGAEPEQTARQHVGLIQQSIAHAERLRDHLGQLRNLGLDWEALVAGQTPLLGPSGELDRLIDAVQGPIAEALVARGNALRWAANEARLKDLIQRLEAHRHHNGGRQPTVQRLLEAVQLGDAKAYALAHAKLGSLAQAGELLRRRGALLAKLELSASTWADQVRKRAGIHGLEFPPADIPGAWLWCQLRDELARRSEISVHEAQAELARAQQDLREVTARFIDSAAWESQARRTSLSHQQALVGWLDTIRKIGKGTGKSAPKLRREAARLMQQAAGAVPVWVMPLSRVVQNFDARSAQFDVVIVDEASQMDVLGLLVFQMAKKVVVVGDHEQVSPAAVGEDQTAVARLILEHLPGIPNAHLYDGKQSVYDLARQSFGGVIRLVEHFRCVPDIINFSNWLSYEGEIRPLREPGDSRLLPQVVAFHVPNAFAESKVNRAEAEVVASLLIAAGEQPEYSGKTFGVVSLVGEEQAKAIDKILRERMSPKDHEQRRVVCGNAAQFQGDERDVMWISMVDAPAGGPLPLRTGDSYKQRFNVAASRAKDQMWVVHSVDPMRDLKAGDLRRRLIEHARQPTDVTAQVERGEARAESEFERQVLRRLIGAGYEVRTQWQVGSYRIDMVVVGGGKRSPWSAMATVTTPSRRSRTTSPGRRRSSASVGASSASAERSSSETPTAPCLGFSAKSRLSGSRSVPRRSRRAMRKRVRFGSELSVGLLSSERSGAGRRSSGHEKVEEGGRRSPACRESARIPGPRHSPRGRGGWPHRVGHNRRNGLTFVRSGSVAHPERAVRRPRSRSRAGRRRMGAASDGPRGRSYCCGSRAL